MASPTVDRGRPVTVGCLFAAMGGFAKAFEAVGGRTRWANERDRFATETFAANFPHVRHLLKDVADVSVAGDGLEPVDVLTAGFPCQPFSNAGLKKGFADERGLAFLHIVRLLGGFGRHKPKVLLLENVEHFRTHDDGRTFRRVQAEVQRAGYWFGDKDAAVLNTAEYTTIPQNRLRLFMVAYSSDHFPRNTFRFPDPVPADQRRPLRGFFDLGRKAAARYYFTPASRYYLPFVETMAKGKPESVYQLRRNYVRENKTGECFTLMANMGLGRPSILTSGDAGRKHTTP